MEGRESLIETVRSGWTKRRAELRRFARNSWRNWEQSSLSGDAPAWGLLIGQHIVALLVTVRVIQSEFHWSGGTAFLVAVIGVLIGLVAQSFWRGSTGGTSSRRSEVVFAFLASIPLLILALSAMNSSWFASAWLIFAFIASLAVGLNWNTAEAVWNRRGGLPILGRGKGVSFSNNERLGEGTAASPELSGVQPRLVANQEAGVHPVQWMRRSVDEHGAEHLEGAIQARFESGESTTTVHVVFCPPFQRTPAFHCNLADGAPARVRTSVAYAYGGRVELKRTGQVESPLSVDVEFEAHVAQVIDRAA